MDKKNIEKNHETDSYRHSIEIKDSAIEKINSIKNKKGEDYILKIEIVAGGCKEYQYVYSLQKLSDIINYSYIESGTSINIQTDIKIQDSDNMKKREQVEVFCKNFDIKILYPIIVSQHKNTNIRNYIIIKNSNPFILIDSKSMTYLSNNTYLEYQNTMTSAIFNLVNDNAKSSCGCGTSFQIKQ